MAGEYSRDTTIYDDRPLDARRLAAIWRQLPERERYGFLLALREDLADTLLVLTYDKGAGDRPAD